MRAVFASTSRAAVVPRVPIHWLPHFLGSVGIQFERFPVTRESHVRRWPELASLIVGVCPVLSKARRTGYVPLRHMPEMVGVSGWLRAIRCCTIRWCWLEGVRTNPFLGWIMVQDESPTSWKAMGCPRVVP